jgi:chromodomain-helicase-DNA-binding protein 4
LVLIEHKRSTGDLEPFDPSSSKVHPDSRVSLRISIKKPTASFRSESVEYIASSSSEAEQEGNSEDESVLHTPPRTSKHIASKVTKNLPYSPRKTRANRTFFTHDDADGSIRSGSEQPGRTLRLRRTRQRSEDEAEVIPSDSDESVVLLPRKSKGKGKSQARKKILPMPSLGVVCSMDDREDDPDPETTLLRSHRPACEKCGHGPAHEMSKKKGRRRKLEEFEEDDDTLGGWLRWYISRHQFYWMHAKAFFSFQCQVPGCHALGMYIYDKAE